MGEDLGTEMALRSLDNILQYVFPHIQICEYVARCTLLFL